MVGKFRLALHGGEVLLHEGLLLDTMFGTPPTERKIPCGPPPPEVIAPPVPPVPTRVSAEIQSASAGFMFQDYESLEVKRRQDSQWVPLHLREGK